ncbi:MAG: DJ-1/PfpI family protein [Clostridia bacterium]|nr:DJ-1/PfpI family protein [Clostridia bacterium]
MVTVFLAQGFEEIEAITPIDVLRRAGLEVRICSITDSSVVEGAHGIFVAADLTLSQWRGMPLEEELAILPGGMPGTLHLKACAPLRDRLLRLNEKGARLAAICAAPTVLGDLGLLKDKSACCYPGMEGELFAGSVSFSPVTVSKNVITSRGAGTAFAFALRLVALLKGEESAAALAKGMCFEGAWN